MWGEEAEGPSCPHQEPFLEPWGTAEVVCSDDLGCLSQWTQWATDYRLVQVIHSCWALSHTLSISC